MWSYGLAGVIVSLIIVPFYLLIRGTVEFSSLRKGNLVITLKPKTFPGLRQLDKRELQSKLEAKAKEKVGELSSSTYFGKIKIDFGQRIVVLEDAKHFYVLAKEEGEEATNDVLRQVNNSVLEKS